MDMRIPLLGIKIMLESNPMKSIMLVRRLAVPACRGAPPRLMSGCNSNSSSNGNGNGRGKSYSDINSNC